MRGAVLLTYAVRGASVGLAVLSFLILALTPAQPVGLALAAAGIASAWLERKKWPPKGGLLVERTLLAAGAIVAAARTLPGGVDWALMITAVGLLGLILVERPLRAATLLWIRSANLGVRSTALMVIRGLVTTIPLLLLTLVAVTALRASLWLAAAATLAVGAAVGAVVADRVRRRLRPSGKRGAVGRALRRHRPEFVLYFAAPAGSQYQILMWLPYLERLDRPFFVLLREAKFLPIVAAATKAPVVFCPTVAAVDEVLVPGLRVAFYVNHAAKNAHCVRFSSLTHIQLHHGDSDKGPSASPVSALFDKIFVAGQAAIDRYARNGVDIPREKFVVVGRPQVESIAVAGTHVRDRTPKVVLYTPTWTGHFSDVNYCSLPLGNKLVKRLLARDVTVLLRAHPYTGKNPQSARQLARIEETLAADRLTSGRAHVWGAEAARDMSLADCINRCDALVSDVSGVISDFLYSGKPFTIVDTANHGEAFADSFPLARAGYVLRRDLSNVDEVLAQLLEEDPLEEARRKVRAEYLGDFPPENYADAFLTEARRYIGPPPGSPD
jgi:hypothetical protein